MGNINPETRASLFIKAASETNIPGSITCSGKDDDSLCSNHGSRGDGCQFCGAIRKANDRSPLFFQLIRPGVIRISEWDWNI